MRRNITLFTAMSLLFLLLLMLSGSISGVLSDIVYFLAFAVPTGLGLWLGKPAPASEDGESRQPSLIEYLGLDGEGAKLFLPCVFPSVALIFLLSFLTSLLISALTGAQSSVEVGDNIFLAMLMHAAVPAVLEEGLFRLLPMRILSGYSRRVTVFLSALYFSLVHNSFFSMPYAFAAGLIFITLDLALDSVWPSVILHFINNAISLLWIFYSSDGGFVLGFSLTLGILAAISLAAIFAMRKRYAERLLGLFSRDERYIPSYEPLMLIIPTVIVAVTELI